MMLRAAARSSKLSIIQVLEVERYLRSRIPGVRLDHIPVKTLGDKVRDKPLHSLGRIGVFEREVDKAILDGRADIAVHSMKDLPTRLPRGLEIVLIPPRADPRDSIVPKPPRSGIRAGARIGTSSIRRSSLARLYYPDARVEALRGNLDTRLRKLDSGQYDYIIVAEAGLKRLNVSRRRLVLDPLQWPPAPAQGLLAVVARADSAVARLLRPYSDPRAKAMAEAERGLLEALGPGCRIPVGGFSVVRNGEVILRAALISGSRPVWVKSRGPLGKARSVGLAAGEELASLWDGDGGEG